VPHATWIPEADSAIAQSLGVFGDAWDLLIVRDLARGHRRFDQLTAELGISRKVLTERLRKLEANSIVQRLPYQDSPARYEYHLTERGSGLVPVLVALRTGAIGGCSATGHPPDWTPLRPRIGCRGWSGRWCRP
jgi:DNA-binding HxlR family transcriptional regulator